MLISSLWPQAAPLQTLPSLTDENPVENFGEAVGRVIAWFATHLNKLEGSFGAFFRGIAQGANIENPTPITWLGIGLGVLLVIGAISSFVRGSVLSGLAQGIIGLAMLSWAVS